jgi:uncharacterized protein YkwD
MRPGLLAVLLVVSAFAWFGRPSPASAFTVAQQENATILTSINADRAKLGLLPLRLDGRLAAWSADRAAWMASHALLTHSSYGGSPCNLFVNQRITWYSCGEAIADSNASPGLTVAAALYALWKGSPEHWALITSKAFNYIGIGTSYRAANRVTYASILFLEGPEHNLPITSWTGDFVSGQTVHWGWTAHAPILQSHTATITGYNVGYEANHGRWHLLRTNSPDVSLTFRNLPHGSTWQIEIQARDSVGNLSVWLRSVTLTVP